jgi:AcrR family transcriptional regulator
VDGRVARGEPTLAAILKSAADIASVEGLDGLSIARVAAAASVSKSGVFARFGSKEGLQLATVRYAGEVFARNVIEPAFNAAPGIERVRRLYEGWVSYSRTRVFPGGCFFFSVTAEFDARSGPVNVAVAAARDAWIRLQEQLISEAQQLGQLAAEPDAAQSAFELDALTCAANMNAVLFDDDTAYVRAERAITARLGAG